MCLSVCAIAKHQLPFGPQKFFLDPPKKTFLDPEEKQIIEEEKNIIKMEIKQFGHRRAKLAIRSLTRIFVGPLKVCVSQWRRQTNTQTDIATLLL